MTKIMPCSCVHPSQDKLHGKGQRVHNSKAAKVGAPVYRCTVCGKERQ